MTSEREKFVALRREVEEYQERYGGLLVTLMWWPEAGQHVFSRGGFWAVPDPSNEINGCAQTIRGSQLLYPPHEAWGHDRRVLGSVFFDPNDHQPRALEEFCELARRVGKFLELLRPDLCESELKPLIGSTRPAVKARDWTLAWIFRRQFNDGGDEPNFGVELTDAFGLLIECMDNELATVLPKSPSPPKPLPPHKYGRTLFRFSVPYSDKEQGETDGPIPPDGFRFDGKPAFGLTPDESKLMAFVWSRRDRPPTWIDAAFHLCPTKRVNGMPAASRDDFNNTLHRLKKKLVDQNWTACIHFAGRGATTPGKLVLREPVKRSKTPAATKRRSTATKLSKGGSFKKRLTKKKRASNA